MSVRGSAAARLGGLGGGLLLLRRLCGLRGMGLRGKVLSAQDCRHDQKREDRKRKSENQRLKKSLSAQARRRWLGIHRHWPWLHHLLHCNLLPSYGQEFHRVVLLHELLRTYVPHGRRPDERKRGATLQGINECIASNN
jgi:hypothetical protein